MVAKAIRVDFQNADTSGRVRLNTAGTLADLDAQNVTLTPGLCLRLLDGELSAEGEVAWSADEAVWVAAVDWNAVIEGT
jgi:hypothetical protein